VGLCRRDLRDDTYLEAGEGLRGAGEVSGEGLNVGSLTEGAVDSQLMEGVEGKEGGASSASKRISEVPAYMGISLLVALNNERTVEYQN
jgi:hypothetical protein